MEKERIVGQTHTGIRSLLSHRRAKSGDIDLDSQKASPRISPLTAIGPRSLDRGGPRLQRKLRVVLYSHDTMGLGHVRRNLLISQSLVSSGLNPDILLVAGARETGSFTTPRGLDCLTLPSLYKETDGQYRSRRMDMPLDELINLRQGVLFAGITAFEPDVLIVDTVPRGVFGELVPTLKALRSAGKTLCILGQRDIRDEPDVVRREWREEKYEEAIRDFYDQVWVYGDSRVYDVINEYGFSPDIAGMVRYTGYLNQRARLDLALRKNGNDPSRHLGLPKRFVLCMVGGGQDGAHLARAFVRSELPGGLGAVLLAGPYMDEADRRVLHNEASKRPGLRVLDFIPEPTALINRANSVIAMGGYNTVSEIVSFGKRALIVPRILPRKEQLIRAGRLGAIGVVDMLHPELLTPGKISQWLRKNSFEDARDLSDRLDIDGLERIPLLLENLLEDACSEGGLVVQGRAYGEI